jgi:CHAT domain-containing protein/lipopolysaccharide biosynthesis regulator YciM
MNLAIACLWTLSLAQAAHRENAGTLGALLCELEEAGPGRTVGEAGARSAWLRVRGLERTGKLEAGLLLAVGDALFAAGFAEVAREAYARGTAASAEAGWPEGEARGRRRLSDLEESVRDETQAPAQWRESVALEDRFANVPEIVALHLRLAGALDRRGRTPEAVRALERAARELERLGRRKEWVEVLTRLGELETETWRMAHARRHLEAAMVEALRLDAGTARRVRMALGRLHLKLREWRKAANLLEGTLRELERENDPSGVAENRRDLAEVYLGLGRNDEARALLTPCLEEWTASGDRVRASGAVVLLSRTLRRQGKSNESYSLIRDTLSDLENETNATLTRARLRDELAKVCRKLGLEDEAWEHRNAAQAVFEAAGAEPEAVRAQLLDARQLFDDGRAGEALPEYRQGMEKALRLVENLDETSAIRLLNRAQNFQDEGLACAYVVSQDPDAEGSDPTRAAFFFAEASRALTLAGGLAHREALISAHASPHLAAQEAETRDQLVALESRLRRLQEDGTDQEYTEAHRAREVEYGRLVDLRSRIAQEAVLLAAAVLPRPVEAGDVQALLAPGQVLVHYALTDQEAYAVVTTQTSVNVVLLGPREAVRQPVQGWLELAAAPGSDERERAEALYDLLVRPLGRAVRASRRLLISADEVLSFLPFEALWVRERKARLVEETEVVYVPSATVFRLLAGEVGRVAPGAGIVAVGDPEGAKLPQSRAEVQEAAAWFPEGVRRVLVGRDATVAGLRKALPSRRARLRALHFACHGAIDRGRPLRSGLRLAEGQLLSAEEIERMQIRADLVVLSACESGRGMSRPGEGVLGLPRAFFLAGCLRAVVSNWHVADGSTRRLMTGFYEGLMGKGLTAAQALRSAKLELLRSSETAHPFHWAGFVLWGSPD